MADGGDPAAEKGVFSGYGREGGPLGSYVGLLGLFNALFAAFLLVTKGTNHRIPERMELADILLLGVATQKVSWLISTDVATSPLRAPFTEFQEMESPSNVSERPRGSGLRRALGELLTCEFCLGPWVASLFTYGLVRRPILTRLVGTIFTILAVSEGFEPHLSLLSFEELEEG